MLPFVLIILTVLLGVAVMCVGVFMYANVSGIINEGALVFTVLGTVIAFCGSVMAFADLYLALALIAAGAISLAAAYLCVLAAQWLDA
ncbi:MAG: hypothetical protein ACR2PG_16200 [Hyphomicrobiaceae bacterium]